MPDLPTVQGTYLAAADSVVAAAAAAVTVVFAEVKAAVAAVNFDPSVDETKQPLAINPLRVLSWRWLLLLHLILNNHLSLDEIRLSLAQGNHLYGVLLSLMADSILFLILRIDDSTKLIQRNCRLGQIVHGLHLLRELGRIKLYAVLLKEIVLDI